MHKRIIIFFVFSLLFTLQVEAAAGYVTLYFKTKIAFSHQVFDAFIETKQYQIIRDFYYSLPLKIVAQEDKDAIEWIQKKAFEDPSLAYIAARTLQVRGYSSQQWKFLVHLFLLYVQLCSVRCQSVELLQERAPLSLFKKHAKCMRMYQFNQSEKAFLMQGLQVWQQRIGNWIDLPDPTWIFCCRLTSPLINVCGYESIVYDPYQKQFSIYFWQPKDENERIAIEVLCQNTYDLWMKRYC